MDEVPVNLLASDGKCTTKSLAGSLTHHVVAGIESLVEVVLDSGDSLHDGSSAGSDITAGLDLSGLDGIGVELDVAILVVVHLQTDATLDLDVASLAGNLPDGPPTAVPEVAGVEAGRSDADVKLTVLGVDTIGAERIVIVHISGDGLLESGTHALKAAVLVRGTDGTVLEIVNMEGGSNKQSKAEQSRASALHSHAHTNIE